MTAGEGSPVFDYTSLDFDGIEADILRYVQSRYRDVNGAEAWTDLNPSNEGRRLVEMVAYACDLLSYNMNARVREAIVASLIRRRNFINQAKTFDYRLKSASPSTTVLEFTMDPGELPFVLPSTFKVSDRTGKIFQPNTDTNATTEVHTVEATNGDLQELELLGESDGTQGQEFVLSQTPLIDDTLTVTVGGVPYAEVRNFIEAGPTDEVYAITTDENDTTTILFGDGINGIIPPAGDEVRATYKIGGGLDTNLPAGAISQLVSSLPGVLLVRNITAAEGGGPKQSVESGKRNLPLSIKANDRAVTLQDYATLAVQLVPGVLKANAVSGRYRGGGHPVLIFVVPNGGGTATAALLNQVVTSIRFGVSDSDYARGLAGKRVSAETAHYVYMILDVEAYVQKGSSRDATVTRVVRAYTNRYDLETVDFGAELDVQDAYNTVDPHEKRIEGLSRVFLKKFTIRPYYSSHLNSTPTGNPSVDEITLGVDPKRREWLIRRVTGGSSAEYEVYERQIGRIDGILSGSITDESGSYHDDELVTATSGYRLRPREQDNLEAFDILSNTITTIAIDTSVNSYPGGYPSNLFLIAGAGDSYVVERLEAERGRIIRTNPDTTVEAGTHTLIVDDATGFDVGNYVLIREGTEKVITRITAKSVNTLTVESEFSYAFTAAATVDWFWWSSTELVGFAVVEGSSPMVVGDEIYVDTFPDVGDLKLRQEKFPRLESGDLTVRGIGGVR